MTAWEARLQHAANLLVGGTGIVYGYMRYFMTPADEWAVVNHPWQPHLQHLHVLAAPLLVFACGLIWRRHVRSNLRNGSADRRDGSDSRDNGADGRRNGTGSRRSGPGLLLALPPMIVSGYLIQTTVTESWRLAWITIHVATSSVWVLAYGAHLVRPYLLRPRQRGVATADRRS
jgi:hypothetical protein